jgi:hypothetical protein
LNLIFVVRVLVGKPEGKRALGSVEHKGDRIFKMELQEV